jgi:phenylacetate-CoA ligase
LDVSLALRYAGRHAIKRNALVSRWTSELVRRERVEPALHRARQDALLGRVLSAARRIPAYARHVAKAPDKHRVAWLADAFPIFDKTSLLEEPTQFFPEGRLPRHRTTVAATSGTTGTPLDVYRSFGSILWEEAFHLQHWHWAGWKRGRRQAVLRGDRVVPLERRQPPFWFQDTAGSQLVFSTRHLHRDSARHFAQELQRFGATHLRAYPSAAYDLATFIAEAGMSVRLDAVITGSEMLYDFQRRRIESTFGCKVFDFYGMAERVAFAAECEHGRMHVNPEYGIVEIVDEHGRPTDGEGMIVGTSLHNHVVPLIRYRMNDSARWSREPCPCGRTYPVIERIGGRLADQLYDLDGRAVNCTIIGFAFDGMRNIRRAQVAQTAADRWVIRIVPAPNYTAADGQRVLDALAAQVSARVHAHVELVSQLPAQANGKFKWVTQEFQRAPRSAAAPLASVAAAACMLDAAC